MMAYSRLPIRSLIILLIYALVGCGSPPQSAQAPVDAELERSNSAARSAFDRGELPEAAMLYEQALTRARAIDDPQEIADAAYNLAACLLRLNDLDRARQLLHEAEWELNETGQNADDVLLLEAKIAREQGKGAESVALTDRLLSQPRSNGASGPPVAVYILRGRLALDRHDVEAAIRELGAAGAAKAALKGNADDLSLAAIIGLSAEISFEQHQMAKAAVQFDEEATLLAAGTDYAGMGRALSRAGDAYLAVGMRAEAADRFYRAGRCLFSLGDISAARKSLHSAMEAAAQAKASPLCDLIQALTGQLSTAASQPSAATFPSIPTEATSPQ
jgi:tetratricopeptide (TPR) repeat protein